jgi:hypothetical protein
MEDPKLAPNCVRSNPETAGRTLSRSHGKGRAPDGLGVRMGTTPVQPGEFFATMLKVSASGIHNEAICIDQDVLG